MSCIPGYNVTNFKNSSICNLVNLQILDLSYNKFNGEVPHCLGNTSTELVVLNLQSNNFKGIIPSICNLVNLQMLDLSYNKFNGKVPHGLGNTSTELVVLNLQSNNYKGIIPSTFSTCDFLEYVDFTDNQLERAISRSLSKCRNLKVLNLKDNQLTGQLPINIGKLTSLSYLSVANNNLIGKITPQITGTLIFSNAYLNCIFQNSFPLHTLRLPTVKLFFSFFEFACH